MELKGFFTVFTGARQFEVCVTFRNKLVFYGEKLLAPRLTPCRLSATSYSIYSQLPYISRGRLLHSQLEDTSCHGDRNPHNMVCSV